MTHVLSIVSTKGGVGKTTLTVHLGVAAAMSGASSLILDLDPQGSAAQWFRERQQTEREEGRAPLAKLSARRVFPNELAEAVREAAEAGFEVVLIDTPPHADFAAARAAEIADIVLMPCRPSPLDLKAASATITLLRDLKKPAYFVVSQALHHSPQSAEDAASYLRSRGIAGAPLVITNLQAYVRALRDGLTAQELDPQSRAAGEIATLWAWLRDQAAVSSPRDDAREEVDVTAAVDRSDPFHHLRQSGRGNR